MRIRFWGTRGSIPAAGKDTVKYGGNTACIEVRLNDGDIIIFDTGTGVRKLGQLLLEEICKSPAEKHKVINIIFTHFHWDHIQGFPFFRPFFDDRFHFRIYGHSDKNLDMKQSLASQIRPPYLPFLFEHLRSKIEFFEVGNEPINIGKVNIYTIPTNHPNSNYGYKIIEGKKKFVLLTDNNLYPPDEITTFDSFVKFCDGADLLVHDAQFNDEEAKNFPTWGHSSFTQVVELSIRAKVRSVVLFHHDPYHGDATVDGMLKKAKQNIKKSKTKIKCIGAKEGLVLQL